MSLIDRTWHLAQTEEEIKITDFEVRLWRVFFGFLRWQEECEKNVNGTNLTGQDLSALHMIRMKDRPKSITDIARLLNRDDSFNIQYSIRKLLKMGLIQKVSSGKSVTYQMTPAGIQNTDNMALARRKILVEMFIKNADLNLESTMEILAKVKSIYDEAEHAAASHIPAIEKKHEKIKKNSQVLVETK